MTDEKSKSDSRGKSIFDLAEGTRPKSGVFEGEALSVATYQVILRPTSSGFGFAFSHDGTSQVTDIEAGSPVASKDILVGDRLIRVNGTRTDNMSYKDLTELLQRTRGDTELKFSRSDSSIHKTSLNPKIQNSNNIQWHNDAIEAESRRRSDIIGELSSCTDEERRDDLEKEFRKSEKLEKEFRRKLLSLQSENLPDGEDSDQFWVGLRNMLDTDKISYSDLHRLFLFLHHRKTLNSLFFVESFIYLQQCKRTLLNDLVSRMMNSFINSAGIMALPYLPQELCSEVEDLISESRAKGDECGLRASFGSIKLLADRKVTDEISDFQGHAIQEKMLKPNLQNADDIILADKVFLDFLSSSEEGYQTLVSIVDLLKWLQIPSGSIKSSIFTRELKKLNKTKRHSSLDYVGLLLPGVKDKLSRWESLNFRPKLRSKTVQERSDSEGKRAVSPVPEQVQNAQSIESLSSPSKQSKDTNSLVSGDSTEDSLNDEISSPTSQTVPLPPPLPEEPEPVDSELEMIELIPWETCVRIQDPNFEFDSMSKTDRARQMVIHELINVHHNACVKIAFIAKIFRPQILERTGLKLPQLTKIFRNIDEIKEMFDALKESLQERVLRDWPLISGVGDILFEFFDLDGEKGQKFQQEVSNWVAKDTDAFKEIKRFCDLPNDMLKMKEAISEAQSDPRLKKLTFKNIMTVIFQTMPRYPMLLTQLIKYTDKETMEEELKFLNQARDSIQVTVSETNKRAGEEELISLLQDIQKHQNIGSFLKEAKKPNKEYLQEYTDIATILQMNQVVKHGTCQVVPSIPSMDKSRSPKFQNDSITYILLKNVLMFFSKDNSIDTHLSNMFKFEIGTSDKANDLVNSISAQQFLLKRDQPQEKDEMDGNEESSNDQSETSSLPGDDAIEEVFSQPVQISASSKSGPKRPAPRPPIESQTVWATPDGSQAESDDEQNENKSPKTTIRRTRQSRATVRHGLNESDLLARLGTRIDLMESHILDSDEARDALESLKLSFLQYKNATS